MFVMPWEASNDINNSIGFSWRPDCKTAENKAEEGGGAEVNGPLIARAKALNESGAP